ncbi:hypothetical protein GCM10023146_25330 [Nocardioides caricicola]
MSRTTTPITRREETRMNLNLSVFWTLVVLGAGLLGLAAGVAVLILATGVLEI